jgi:hypothetical protein
VTGVSEILVLVLLISGILILPRMLKPPPAGDTQRKNCPAVPKKNGPPSWPRPFVSLLPAALVIQALGGGPAGVCGPGAWSRWSWPGPFTGWHIGPQKITRFRCKAAVGSPGLCRPEKTRPARSCIPGSGPAVNCHRFKSAASNRVKAGNPHQVPFLSFLFFDTNLRSKALMMIFL